MFIMYLKNIHSVLQNVNCILNCVHCVLENDRRLFSKFLSCIKKCSLCIFLKIFILYLKKRSSRIRKKFILYVKCVHHVIQKRIIVY